MKLLRISAIIFSLSVPFFWLGAPEAHAQLQPLVPQLAKNSGELKKVAATSEDPAPTSGESESSTTNRSTVSLSRIGVNSAQTIPLTLNEAIQRALENNNEIEVAKNDVRIAESNLRALLGLYDGVASFAPTFDRNRTTGQSATNDFRANTEFWQPVRQGGGNLRLFLNNSRTENRFAQQQLSSGAPVSTNGAVYASSLGVSFSQPLGRNMKIDSTRRQIKIQRKRVTQSDADFRRQAISVIAQVQQSYWDLVFALRNQQNQVANVNLSRENLRQVEAKIEAGVAAPLQKAEIETELATREGELLTAIQQVSAAENRLKQLLLKDPESPEWSIQYVPTDTPVYSSAPIDLEAAMKDAIDNRPELSRLRLEKEINKIDIEYFRNQTKPRIDLTSTFSLDGLSLGNVNTSSFTVGAFPVQPIGGETNVSSYFYNLMCRNSPTPPQNCANIPQVNIMGAPEFMRGGYSRSLQNLFRSDAPNFTVGVTFSFPLRNRTAKADLATARMQSERIDAQTRSQEQAIITEVRNAVQAVETARQRVLTARRARENAEIQLEGERKLFEVGRSTAFFLFQRENALTNARNAEIRAETDYNKALSDLQRVTSTTFRANGIEVDSPVNDQD